MGEKGGGDGPESLNQGLAEAVGRADWREGAAKVMFLIADAQPHMDYDGDGYGDDQAAPTSACAPPPDAVTNDGDCDDTDPDVHPGAEEVCNGLDDDCDSIADNGPGMECVLGTSGIFCLTGGGEVGTQDCSASCVLSACCASTRPYHSNCRNRPGQHHASPDTAGDCAGQYVEVARAQ